MDIGADIDIQQLKHKVFVMPTETVYGLMADATNKQLVSRIYDIKQRPHDNPLICHFHSLEQIKEYVDMERVPDYWEPLAGILSPGPVSYILPVPSGSVLSPAIAGQKNVVARIPSHPLALKIIETLGVPLAGPSANTSGKYSGTSYDMIFKDLGDKVDEIIDDGPAIVGLESTIIDCTQKDQLKIVRPGFVGIEDVQEVLEKVGFGHIKAFVGEFTIAVTPGAKYRHYASHTDLGLVGSLVEAPKEFPVLLVMPSAQDLEDAKDFPEVIIVGNTPAEVAARLYHSLFELDQLKFEKASIFFGERYRESEDGLKLALENRFSKILARD
jgi:L-threonylcarbamoyladenylate synthase